MTKTTSDAPAGNLRKIAVPAPPQAVSGATQIAPAQTAESSGAFEPSLNRARSTTRWAPRPVK